MSKERKGGAAPPPPRGLSFEASLVKTRGGKLLWLPAADRRAADLSAAARVYGATSLRAMRSLVAAPRVVFDVGANAGQSALEYKGWATECVVSFEPDPDMFALLAHNLLLNSGGCEVRPVRAALGARHESGAFTSSPSGSLGGHFSKSGKKTVDVCRLDDFAGKVYSRKGEELPVDVVKLDVEGYEHQVFLGGREFLREYRPLVLAELVPEFMRRYGDSPEDFCAGMRGLGYRRFRTDLTPDKGYFAPIPRERDRIFVHKDAPYFPRERGLGVA